MTGKMESFLNLEQYKSVVVTYMEKSRNSIGAKSAQKVLIKFCAINHNKSHL